MNKITKEETGFRGKVSKVSYEKKYVLRKISGDGLVKHDENVSEYETFQSEDEALEFCASREIWDVVILPIVVKNWLVD